MPRSPRRTSSRRTILTAVVVVASLATGAYVLDGLAGTGGYTAEPVRRATSPGPSPSASPSPSPESAAPSTEPPPVLSRPGDFPIGGPARFRFVDEEGEVLGESGRLLRYRLGLEQGLDEDLDEFAEFVDETLGAGRGWTAGGDLRFQRVPGRAAYDFTIYLASSETSGEMCAGGGLYVLGSGLPEGGVSCRLTGQVILNYSRWRLSVPQYVDDEVPLSTYRRMLINHEVGHELGYGHEACPGRGEPAPVMQQQSIDLGGCDANPWPYRDGRRYAGLPVA